MQQPEAQKKNAGTEQTSRRIANGVRRRYKY
jgi:hypothetical protein